jgi:hypothetical protein
MYISCNGKGVALMALLAVISLADMVYTWYGYISKTREIPSSEVVVYSSID